jgi:chemosensory pili system protein ChpA (sensor histidine kinase/response regulator)
VQLLGSMAQVEAAMRAGTGGVQDTPTIQDVTPAAPVTPEVVKTVPTVMVVDDSLTVRKITSRFLSREGYQVITAKDGVDALEQLQTTHPDVMLVDIEMPRMDGFDLTRNVRADARLKATPIVMITSRTADKHRTYAKEIGVNVFLGKPYQEDELLKHVAILAKQGAAALA